MKKMLQHTVLATVCLGVMPPAMANWELFDRSEIHVAGVYSKPSNNGIEVGSLPYTQNNLNLGSTTINNLLSPVLNAQQLALSPGFQWNYALGYSYLYCNSQTRLFMDYEYFQDSATLSGPDVSQGLITEEGDLFSRVDERQNMFRAGLQHYVKFSPQFMVDFSVFFEYDRLVQNIVDNITDADSGLIEQIAGSGSTVALSSYMQVGNKMHGFGPGIGFKVIGAPLYRCPSIKLFGGVMTSLLYAYQYGNFLHDIAVSVSNSSGGGGSIDLPIHLYPQTNKSLVSKFDIDLGIDYSQKMTIDCSKMLMGITLGVRYVNMINALKYSNHHNFMVVQSLSNYDPVDWGRAGPYIQFRLGGVES